MASYDEDWVHLPEKVIHKPKVPKNFTKYGYVQRFLMNNRDLINRFEPETARNITKALSQVEDPFGLSLKEFEGRQGQLNGSVCHSLNKKGRWKHVDVLRDEISQFQNEYHGVQVSAIEKYERPDKPMLWNRESQSNLVRAYHAVDQNGQEDHRFARSTVAQERTLTEKPHPKRKRKNNRRLRHISPMPNPDQTQTPKHHLRYKVTTTFPCAAFYKKAVKEHGSEKKSCWAQNRRKLNNEECKYIRWCSEVDDEVETEWEDTIESDEIATISHPLPTVTLSECVKVKSKPKKGMKKSATPSPLECTSDKPWLRQLSYQSEPEAGTSGVTSASENLPSEVFLTNQAPSLPMDLIPIKLGEESIDTDELAFNYGLHYYECVCIPRRFCIDISDSVKDVMAVARREQAKEINIKAICVFEVQTQTLADLKIICDYPEEEPISNVKFWVNIDLSHSARGMTLKPNLKKGKLHQLGSVLKDVTVLIGTLPPSFFKKQESSHRPTLTPKRNESSASLVDLIPPIFMPETQCLINGQIAELALKESEMARKLQRQITAVHSYQCYMETSDNMCGVCLDWPINEQGMCLAQCQHWFCNDCWAQHGHQQLTQGHVPILCPDADCDQILDYDTLTTVLPLSQCERYSTLLSERHLLQNAQSWIWCPNERCGRLIKLDRPNDLGILTCECGQIWCVKCSETPHWPVGCEHANRYMERVKNYGDNLNKRLLTIQNTVDVKRCPRCQMPMEKSLGCNHMACRCGGEFCWSCLSPWNSGTHYNCALTSKFGTETMVLRDIHSKSDNSMNMEYYKKCVAHRQALFSERKYKLRESLVRQKKEIVDDFMKLHEQIHSLLEFAYVWMYFRKVNRQQKVIWSTADRLNFIISHAEQLCLEKKGDRAVDLMDKGRRLLKTLTLRILAVKE